MSGRDFRVQIQAGIDRPQGVCSGWGNYTIVTKVISSTAEDETGPIQLTPGELSEATAFAASLEPGLQVCLQPPSRTEAFCSPQFLTPNRFPYRRTP